jgi:KaiC/GvpD/RAD55 family RecA-like ATPase
MLTARPLGHGGGREDSTAAGRSISAPEGEPRISTGNPGIDAMLEGGVIARRPYLIVGPAGTGKSTLALQFLCEGVRRGERSLLVTIEEPPNELRLNHRGLGPEFDRVDVFDAIPDVMRYERVPFKDISAVRQSMPFGRVPLVIRRTPELTGVEVTITALEQMLRSEVARRGYTRVAIDSLTALQYFCMKGFNEVAGAQTFLRFLSDLHVTTFLTVESPLEDVDTTERMLARGEIRLFRWELDNMTVYAVGVEKFRGGSHDVRLHPYRIGPKGIDITLDRTISRDTRLVVEPAPVVTIAVPPPRSPLAPLEDEIADLVAVGADVDAIRTEVEAALASAALGDRHAATGHVVTASAMTLSIAEDYRSGAPPSGSPPAPAEVLRRIVERSEAARAGIAPTELPTSPELERQLQRVLDQLPRSPGPAAAPVPAPPAERARAPAPAPAISRVLLSPPAPAGPPLAAKEVLPTPVPASPPVAQPPPLATAPSPAPAIAPRPVSPPPAAPAVVPASAPPSPSPPPPPFPTKAAPTLAPPIVSSPPPKSAPAAHATPPSPPASEPRRWAPPEPPSAPPRIPARPPAPLSAPTTGAPSPAIAPESTGARPPPPTARVVPPPLPAPPPSGRPALAPPLVPAATPVGVAVPKSVLRVPPPAGGSPPSAPPRAPIVASLPSAARPVVAPAPIAARAPLPAPAPAPPAVPASPLVPAEAPAPRESPPTPTVSRAPAEVVEPTLPTPSAPAPAPKPPAKRRRKSPSKSAKRTEPAPAPSGVSEPPPTPVPEGPKVPDLLGGTEAPAALAVVAPPAPPKRRAARKRKAPPVISATAGSNPPGGEPAEASASTEPAPPLPPEPTPNPPEDE